MVDLCDILFLNINAGGLYGIRQYDEDCRSREAGYLD